MKKIMMLAVAAIMATMSASAQFEPGKWSIDINIGLGASWLNKAEEAVIQNIELDKQVAPAVFMGISASYQLNRALSLSAGLNYGTQGQSWENFKTDGIKYSNNTLELTYIQIPILAHLYFYKGWSFNIGFQPGFLVNADLISHLETKTEGHKVTSDTRIDYQDDLETFDLTIPLGISYEFKKHFVLGAQYNLGVTPVNDKGNFFESKTRNGAFLLTLGGKLGL